MELKMAKKPQDIIKEKIVGAAYEEGIDLFRKWRQTAKNGILPIGISGVGKTTFLARFDVSGSELFLDFDRTLSVKVDKMRLRDDFIKQSNGAKYFQKLDVPGELPELWGQTYFNRNPRVLVIMIDERDSAIHIDSIKQFLILIKEGPSAWQKIKTVIGFRRENLSRVIFAVNKVDKFDSNKIGNIKKDYKSLLAEVQSSLNVNVQMFQISLNSANEDDFNSMFTAVLDGLSRK